MIEEVYGLHAVTALLHNPYRKIEALYLSLDRQDQRMRALWVTITEKNIPVTALSAANMALKFPDKVHQGIVAFASPLPRYHEQDIPQLLAKKSSQPFILILDGITDPHNLGACLRVADGAGVDFVIIPKDKAVGLTPVVSKVACGAAESMPLISVSNLARSMEKLKQLGIWVYGATDEAPKSLYTLEATIPLAIVLGAEGQGLRHLTKERCDGLFAIPMHGMVSSLNVSVAAGVCLYEMMRKRGLSR